MIYFYDASEHFIKDGKKNALVDVEKIVDRVSSREVVEYCSKLAEPGDTLSPNAYVEKATNNDNPYAGLSLEEFNERVRREHSEFRERIARLDAELEALMGGT